MEKNKPKYSPTPLGKDVYREKIMVNGIELDTNIKYGIDGQYIKFHPILLNEGDWIEQDGTILRYMGNNEFLLVCDNPKFTFVPPDKLTKKWNIMK